MGKYSIENLLRFTDRGASNLATSLLDEIVSRDEVDQQSPLYKLSNFKKAGSIIERYLLEGQKELESIATCEIKKYMYNDGEGEDMNMGNAPSNKETVVNVNNGVKENTRRKVCWKLDHRGMLGESLLHILVICNTDAHTHIAMYLLDMYSALAQDIVEGEEYYGATAMHFAIAYENSKLVKKLVEVGANVLQKANGKFFMPIDQQWPIPRPKTNFEGLSYFGEYPLAWAACCDDESSYNLLLKHGADPNMQDTFGNSILHVLVIRDKLKMYGYALRHPHRPASDHLCNKYGLTPLTLACKLGRNTIFREMLEFSSLEFWRYSNITCSGYPLNALDSLQPNGRANMNSALMIILKGNSTEHLDMLEGGVIQRLLEEKWKTFAQRYFYKRLMMMMFHLFNLSIAVFLRPTTREPLFGKVDASSIIRYYAEIATCLGCIAFGIFQQVQEILAQGLTGFLLSLTTSPVKTFFLLSCVLTLSCIPCRVLEDRETEDVLLTIAIPCSWFYLIFFAGAVRLTGPFVTMIYSMVTGDMFTFSIIYTIFLFGFTQAFYFLFKHPPSDKNDTKKRFASYPVTWMSLFHMTLGSYEYEEFRETYYQKLTQLVFAVFMVFTPILLLNMLIAMMGNTYCEVITQSEKEWVKQWANIIVALERAIDSNSAKEFVQTYSIKMPSTDKDTEVRGVIVIKTKLKSKAKEKKQALSLWKRVGKRTVQELRKVGGTAAEVRRRYNLFRSKQPTARLRMGKVVQEWNPVPMPVYTNDPPPAVTEVEPPTNNAGFNDLLSKVASASGIDIEKPVDMEKPTERQPREKSQTANAGLIVKPPEYKEYADISNAYVNLAFERKSDATLNIVSKEGDIQQSNHNDGKMMQSNPILSSYFDKNINFLSNSTHQQTTQLNPEVQQSVMPINSQNQIIKQPNLTTQEFSSSNPHKEQVFLHQKSGSLIGNLNDSNLKSEFAKFEEPSKLNCLGKLHEVNIHSEQLKPVKLTDEKGISVSIQTRIINTRITKSRIRRRKDAMFPLRNEYSDSTSEKESKRGFLLHRKENNGVGLSAKGSSKYKRRRKRNQISSQEKISLDKVPYDIPVSTDNPLCEDKEQL